MRKTEEDVSNSIDRIFFFGMCFQVLNELHQQFFAGMQV